MSEARRELGEMPRTMSDTVRRIIEIAAERHRPEEEIYGQARAEWNLPTVASWAFLKHHPYA